MLHPLVSSGLKLDDADDEDVDEMVVLEECVELLFDLGRGG
jgi:hypothetical protein